MQFSRDQSTDSSDVFDALGVDSLVSSPSLTGSTFDGALVLSYNPKQGDVRLTHATDYLVEVLGTNTFSKVSAHQLDKFFGLIQMPDHRDQAHGDELAPGSVSEICSKLLFESYPNDYTRAFTLRSSGGTNVHANATFSLLPLDLEAGVSSRVAILCLVQDLSRVSTENLVGESQRLTGDSNTTHGLADTLSVGTDLGKLSFQVCKNLEQELANRSGDDASSFAVSMGIAGPAGVLAPVILGGFTASSVESICDTLERTVISEHPVRIPLESFSLAVENTLMEDGVTSLWALPIPGPTASVGEATQFGTIFDLGSRQLRSFELYGMIVIAERATAYNQNQRLDLLDQSPSSVELLRSAQKVMAEAIDSAYQISSSSVEHSHDVLTSLPNRENVLGRLEQVLASNDADHTDVSVLLVDIDKFQSINHSFGSDTGDLILKEIANRLLSSVRLGDQVGRISSDQYLVICVTPKGELDPSSVAKRVLNTVNKPFRMNDGGELTITSSLGAVQVEDTEMSPLDVLGQAESALGRAVAKGRGEFCLFDQENKPLSDSSAALEVAIRAGIEASEFMVYYQPLVDIDSGRMVGAEALVRWQREDGTIVSPGDFIEVAEESGLIVDLGMWIIDQVCADLANWPANEMGKPVVTINLSARQLESDMLVPGIISALRRNNLHPSNVGFEITESMEISNMEVALETLAKLKELNCRIAIDDFGIGHATMDYLRSFSNADALKIDRSFVSGLTTSLEDTAIVTASIALADALGMQVVAEGVETGVQLEALKKLRCRYGQGFGFSRPVPYEDCQELWMKSFIPAPE